MCQVYRGIVFPYLLIGNLCDIFFSSEASGSKNKTVLFWIHGGGYTEGGHREGLYGPDFLLSEDNVVVAVQYRLGIFGFMSLGFVPYTGNMGLKDQRLALQWVHENIENFSGNKDEVLVFGESAGKIYSTCQKLRTTRSILCSVYELKLN